MGFVDGCGNYRDDIGSIAAMQLSSPWLFWFNTVTSIPVAWIEWTTVRVRMRQAGGGGRFKNEIINSATDLRKFQILILEFYFLDNLKFNLQLWCVSCVKKFHTNTVSHSIHAYNVFCVNFIEGI